jgi:hypothetical protein
MCGDVSCHYRAGSHNRASAYRNAWQHNGASANHCARTNPRHAGKYRAGPDRHEVGNVGVMTQSGAAINEAKRPYSTRAPIFASVFT